MQKRTRGEVALDLISDLREFIDHNYNITGLQIEDYLAISNVGLDMRQMQRMLNCIGTSWRKELIGRRMREAKKLLRQSAMAVSAIATAVGYNDAAHFSKEFRKHNEDGMSPGEYRRAARKAAR